MSRFSSSFSLRRFQVLAIFFGILLVSGILSLSLVFLSHDPHGPERVPPKSNCARDLTSGDLTWKCKAWKNGKKYVTLWEEEECREYDVRFAEEGCFPPTPFISFPGSGNTWLRYLIEATTGIFTGSVYCDEDLYQLGFLGEGVEEWSGQTILQKTHEEGDVEMFEGRALMLIRNPFRAYLSFYSFMTARGSRHTQDVPLPTPNDTQWQRKFSEWQGSWRSKAETWIENFDGKVMLVFYENLLLDWRKELGKILAFLGMRADRGRLECLGRHLEGKALRKRFSRTSYMASYSESMTSQVLDEILELKGFLFGFGFPTQALDSYLNYSRCKGE
ncbi:unnamed protein product [Darwinula stevensoni]|uniref:Sulfotransferase domain-containing protein n=1 Tax=Darwinula stevensoni TaxID=69355 RepID=A0A7R8XEI9_9CRUS|nr:unnamed protein product [Darwinula stevensoni]CAG0887874.1 unnamed protein product [Darwinula stevensoni]